MNYKKDNTVSIFRCLFIIKIFTKHYLTIIYSNKSHIFALGPGLHKNALGLITVKKEIKKKKKEKGKKINNKPTTKENNAEHIYNLQKLKLSAGYEWGGDSGNEKIYMESILRGNKKTWERTWACKEHKD